MQFRSKRKAETEEPLKLIPIGDLSHAMYAIDCSDVTMVVDYLHLHIPMIKFQIVRGYDFDEDWLDEQIRRDNLLGSTRGELEEEERYQAEIAALARVHRLEWNLDEKERTNLARIELRWPDCTRMPTADQVAEAMKPPPGED